MRRERVSITAFSDAPGVPPVTVEGQLTSFQVNTRMTYDLGGRRLRQSDDKVEVIVYMQLDPEDARIFRDRNKPRPVRRLITRGEREFRAVLRGMQLLEVGTDVRTYWQVTGTLPPSRQITARSSDAESET